MNHRYTAVVLAGLLIFPVVGCISSGQKVNPSRVAQIVDGTTTRAHVLKMFGKPSGYTPEGGERISLYPAVSRKLTWGPFGNWGTFSRNSSELGKTGRAETWHWSYASTTLGQGNSYGQYLSITLDVKGIVESHKWSESRVPSD